MAEKILASAKRVQRHGLVERLIHWSVAISTFVLLFSGFGQMPLYKRYMVDTLSGLAWTSDFDVTLNIHYIAAIVLLFAVIYHLVYHGLKKEHGIIPKKGDLKESYLIIKAMVTGGKEPDSHKYLAEQRLAYAFIGFNLILVIVTGMIKVIKNIPGVELSQTFISLATNFHNLATVLLLFGIIAHLVAFLPKVNRSLLPSMFSGKVSYDYVKHRHNLWLRDLERKGTGNIRKSEGV